MTYDPEPSADAGENPRPRLSILTPFYHDDPSRLIDALAAQIAVSWSEVEFVLFDDGSQDEALIARLFWKLSTAPFPARLIVAPRNNGRAMARNALKQAACGDHLLLLDSDVIPDGQDFVARWLEAIDQGAAIAFGGFSMLQAPRNRQTALHLFLSQRSECRSAAERNRNPAQFTTTCNLLIRRDILDGVPFDESFSGWGWEDVDWALRAAEREPIRHIDNTVTHAGLDSAAVLLRKFREAGPNYGRLADKHPDAVRRFASWRAARAIAHVPFQDRMRPLLAGLAAFDAAPIGLRYAALKLYRASIYAEHTG